MATETEAKIRTDQARTEIIPEPPPKWLIELAKQTCDRADQAHQRIVELDRKSGR